VRAYVRTVLGANMRDEHVYCADCKYFEMDEDFNAHCVNADICNLSEVSEPFWIRPVYKRACLECETSMNVK